MLTAIDEIDCKAFDASEQIEEREYQIDASMMGDDWEDEYDIVEFAEILQQTTTVKIIPIIDSENGAKNEDPDLITDSMWAYALSTFLARMQQED